MHPFSNGNYKKIKKKKIIYVVLGVEILYNFERKLTAGLFFGNVEITILFCSRVTNVLVYFIFAYLLIGVIVD